MHNKKMRSPNSLEKSTVREFAIVELFTNEAIFMLYLICEKKDSIKIIFKVAVETNLPNVCSHLQNKLT